MQTALTPTRIRRGVYHVPGVGLLQCTRREAFEALEEARANLAAIEQRQQQNRADLEKAQRLLKAARS